MEGFGLEKLILFMFSVFLSLMLFAPSSGMAIPAKGEVVMATGWSRFYQVGGDSATQRSGAPFLARTIFDSLTYVNKEQKMLPSLAKSWKIAPDWKYIDFFLRDDVPFHNGDKFTAEDVKFSLETYMRKDFGFVLAPVWQRNLTKIEILGPYQIRVHLKAPDLGFLGSLWWGAGMMPKKYREQVGDRGFADKPIGTGPYKWVEYKQDSFWKVEAVKKHFRHTPAIKTLKMLYVPDIATRLAMLKAGEVDIDELMPPNIPDVKSDPKLRMEFAKYTQLNCLVFADLNSAEPSPFKDIRVREAVSLAIDREGITKKILFGTAEPYGDFCSPITLGYDKTIKPDPYNPEKAKKLLAEAGYPNGFETVLSPLPADRYWMEAVASNLEAVGIKTKVDLMEPGAWIQKLIGKKFQGLLEQPLWFGAQRSAAGNASGNFLSYMPFCYNTTPEIEKAITEGMSAMTDAEGIASGKKISKAIRESRNKVLLWAIYHSYGLGPRIEHWQPQIGVLPPSDFELIRLKKQYQ
jgi:ABC-type transport system substrate-binding protein